MSFSIMISNIAYFGTNYGTRLTSKLFFLLLKVFYFLRALAVAPNGWVLTFVAASKP